MPTWVIWLLAMQAVGVAVAVMLIVWCCYCRNAQHRRRVLLSRVSRLVSSATSHRYCLKGIFFESLRDDCSIIIVGHDDEGIRENTMQIT